jgi:hypothetical protein
MPNVVSRMLPLLCTLVVPLRVGTNLGLLHLLWMLVSGRLLTTWGRRFPAWTPAASRAKRCGEPRRRWARTTGPASTCCGGGRDWWQTKGAGRCAATVSTAAFGRCRWM